MSRRTFIRLRRRTSAAGIIIGAWVLALMPIDGLIHYGAAALLFVAGITMIVRPN